MLFGPGVLAQDIPAVNEIILDYAQDKVGTSVGDGLCCRLVWAALEKADRGWKRKVENGDLRGDNIYGMEVDSSEVLPGDIMIWTKVVLRDGVTARNHVGIVYSVDGNGKFNCLEQNVGKNKMVDYYDRDVSEVVSGKISFYRYDKNITFVKNNHHVRTR
jgi:hypothetical protein